MTTETPTAPKTRQTSPIRMATSKYALTHQALKKAEERVTRLKTDLDDAQLALADRLAEHTAAAKALAELQ